MLGEVDEGRERVGWLILIRYETNHADSSRDWRAGDEVLGWCCSVLPLTSPLLSSISASSLSPSRFQFRLHHASLLTRLKITLHSYQVDHQNARMLFKLLPLLITGILAIASLSTLTISLPTALNTTSLSSLADASSPNEAMCTIDGERCTSHDQCCELVSHHPMPNFQPRPGYE
jgi:hypothetical protein